MKKSVWIFLLAVLLPSVVLGWLALRSAEEQQIVFERRTAELYQKETDSLALTVRDTVDAERRVFGETIHRLLAKGDAEALARDFTNTLTDAWEVKAVGFAINSAGKLVSPSVATASKKPELQRFLLGNGGFLTSTEPAIVYNSAGDNNPVRNNKLEYSKIRSSANQSAANAYSGNATGTAAAAGRDAAPANEGNEVVLLADSSGSPGGAPLTFGNSSNGIATHGGLPQINTQMPVSPGQLFAPNSVSTVVLNGGVQLMCQVPANVSAFDFTGVMSPQDQRNFTGNPTWNLQTGIASGDQAAFILTPQLPADRAKTDSNVIFFAPTESSAVVSFAMRESDGQSPAAAIRNRAPGAGGAAAPEPADKNAPADHLKEKQKMTPAEQTVGGDMPKKSGGKSEELKDRATVSGKGTVAMQAERATGTDARRAGELLPSKRMLDPDSPIAIPTEPVMPIPAAPAPSPGKAIAPAPVAQAKEMSDIAPAAKPQAAAAPQMPATALRKSATAQNIQKAADELGAQAVLTKTGAGVLALNNAVNRQVEPQQVLGVQGPALSTIMPEEAEFRSLTEEGDDGMVARFVQDKLNLIFWVRPPEAPEMVFGCLVETGHFSELWKEVLERHRASSRTGRAPLESQPEFVLALLDDRGKPVATQPADAAPRDWKRPFVASEIGEALPHWEAALYLASPTALAESARGLWRTLAFTIAGAVALIAFGGWLVVADARRQLALAQQKTDFVSNVSHELKTPLTSIRMFAELMHDRPQPPEKQGQYLRIITVEAERLTRLINNVLDFAKIGRKQKRIEKKPLDLHANVARVWESQELHLREDGFTTRWEAAPGSYPVLGDDDALAQVLVNLLSNAEKYANGNKEVELHTWLDDGWVNVSVLDRGMGVPKGDEKKIFEAFYRAHDSLASGIQGSGLGLTLAQRIAREHGGEIKLEHREGGGSRFTLRLPLAGVRS